MKVTKAQIKVTLLQGYVWHRLLTTDLPLVKGLSALRRNLEMHPSSRGDCHHEATLPSGESSKKAHLDCLICGIKWFTHRQITCDGKGMHETPSTHNLLCSLINESSKAPHYSWVNCMIGVPSSYALMLTVSLCSVVDFQRTDWN